MSNPTGKGGLQERKHHINRKGRPKTFDKLRALTQMIAHETITTKDGQELTVVEAIMRQWATDKKHQKDFMEYAFGKVPDRAEITGEDGKALVIKVKIQDDND